ncbi:MAG: GntR family transcriptional regulator [Lachnospiraceae bacterium]|nr:GntR family transcriptional regulator [Lachnospiraceae bacterium]
MLIKTVSLADQIFEKLENDILEGVYKRGEILTEQKLSEELGVSRTPVREALRMLEQEHIIEDNGKGLVVLGITADDAENIYRIRERVEGLAAAECVRRITDEEVKQLSDILDLEEFYAQKGDNAMVREEDSAFHALLYKISGTIFYDTLVPLHKKLQKFRRLAVTDEHSAEASVREHRVILEALRKRDEVGAEAAMNSHVHSARERVRRSSRMS